MTARPPAGATVAFDWRLTLVALVLLPLIAIPMRRAGRRVYEARGATQSKLAELTAYLQEVLGISGALLVKAFVRERAEQERSRRTNDDLRHLEIHAAMIARRFGTLMRVLQTLGSALIILAGGWLVIHEGTSVGTVFVFATVLTARFAMSAGSLGEAHVNLVGSLALFRRIFTVLDDPCDVADRDGARDVPTVEGALELEHVTFAYPTQARPALIELSARIEPGQLVALVGPSGAGKTTLTTLIPRFYDPQDGRVLFDGHDVRDVTLESLRRHVGIVFQDTYLFHASIRENLLYARADATEAQMIAAATAAYIHDFIASLPDGYDTIVGERGHRLSGGEKQRVAIARVILKDPRILILDEATSNLDSVSEQLIQAALAPLFVGRSSVVIAHRLSTILAADRILVLDRGRLSTTEPTPSCSSAAACTAPSTSANSAASPSSPRLRDGTPAQCAVAPLDGFPVAPESGGRTPMRSQGPGPRSGRRDAWWNRCLSAWPKRRRCGPGRERCQASSSVRPRSRRAQVTGSSSRGEHSERACRR